MSVPQKLHNEVHSIKNVQSGGKGRNVGNINWNSEWCWFRSVGSGTVSLFEFLFPKIISGFVTEKLLLCYNLSFIF